MKATTKAFLIFIGICTPFTSAWRMGRIMGAIPTGAIPDPARVPLTAIITKPRDCTEMSVGISRLNPGRRIEDGEIAEDDPNPRRPLRVFQGIQIQQGNTNGDELSGIKYLGLWVNKRCEGIPQVIIHFWDDPGTMQEANLNTLRLAVEGFQQPFNLGKMGWWSWGEIRPLEDGTDRFPWVPEGGVAWRISRYIHNRDRHGSFVIVPNAIRVGKFVTNPDTRKVRWEDDNAGVGLGWNSGAIHNYVLPEFENGLIAVPKERAEVGIVGGTREQILAKADANLRARESVQYVATGNFVLPQRDAQPNANNNANAYGRPRSPDLEQNSVASGYDTDQILAQQAGVNGDVNQIPIEQAGSNDDTDQIEIPPNSDAIVEAPSFLNSLYEFGAAALIQQAEVASSQLSYEIQHLTEDQISELRSDQISLLPPTQLVDLLFLVRVRRELLQAGHDYETAMVILRRQLADLHAERDRPVGMDMAESGITYGPDSDEVEPDQLGPAEIQRLQALEAMLKKEEEQQGVQTKIEEIPPIGAQQQT
ncbi:hypothetical protein TWF718_001429 [Orbilia javanica]|uniref:Uncharacterized protein n=1 Tax=Orbilia javanica TaxID=47235 RepID=A0AAN8RNB1_9PEZI